MSAFIITRIQVGDCDLQRLRGDGSASVAAAWPRWSASDVRVARRGVLLRHAALCRFHEASIPILYERT